MKLFVRLVQPPFTQLNSPYPGLYYLRTFLKARGCEVSVSDHSIRLFEKIFCKSGLERIFADAQKTVKSGGFSGARDRRLRPIIERFLSEEGRWVSSIDRLIAFLRGQDREWGHLLGLANGALPGGPGFDACLGELCDAKGEAAPDDAPLLAGRLLSDIAGFITLTLDPGFSLIRYVPCAGTSRDQGFGGFSAVKAGLDGYILKNFYRPFLAEEWKKLDEDAGQNRKGGGSTPFLLGLSIPFPGCLAGALACAESAKAYFGRRIITLAGGGYVNTELRFIEEESFFDYFDYLSFDRAYGSLDAILGRIAGKGAQGPLYKTIFLSNGRIVRDDKIADNTENADSAGMGIDDEAVKTVFPDYSGVDFSRYICPVDDANPMHRLWSDGRWLKAYTAHGCYWHNCAFCDTGLDYIRCFKPVDAAALFRHLAQQAGAAGVRGVHLADEACPPASLLRLALLNREAGLPLLFWGNIRFEKSFTPDAAAVLAAGGVIGLSAGIEVASEKGFKRIGKGIGLADVVSTCAAFKEAGILVHAYLIYGYWDEDDQELIDSVETLRQLFAAGLLDSAFWHQFILTKHSRIYAEKLRGMYPELRVIGDKPGAEKIFALNDLAFAGGERFDRYTLPLDRLLRSWMKGDTSQPVQTAFPFDVPGPSTAPDLVDRLLDAYIRRRDSERESLPDTGKYNAVFLGSGPVLRLTEKGAELRWRWKLDDCVLRIKAGTAVQAEKAAALLKAASEGNGTDACTLFKALETNFGSSAKQVWKTLRRQGLALIVPLA